MTKKQRTPGRSCKTSSLRHNPAIAPRWNSRARFAHRPAAGLPGRSGPRLAAAVRRGAGVRGPQRQWRPRCGRARAAGCQGVQRHRHRRHRCAGRLHARLCRRPNGLPHQAGGLRPGGTTGRAAGALAQPAVPRRPRAEIRRHSTAPTRLHALRAAAATGCGAGATGRVAVRRQPDLLRAGRGLLLARHRAAPGRHARCFARADAGRRDR